VRQTPRRAAPHARRPAFGLRAQPRAHLEIGGGRHLAREQRQPVRARRDHQRKAERADSEKPAELPPEDAEQPRFKQGGGGCEQQQQHQHQEADERLRAARRGATV
jgi:hypothetical protein